MIIVLIVLSIFVQLSNVGASTDWNFKKILPVCAPVMKTIKEPVIGLNIGEIAPQCTTHKLDPEETKNKESICVKSLELDPFLVLAEYEMCVRMKSKQYPGEECKDHYVTVVGSLDDSARFYFCHEGIVRHQTCLKKNVINRLLLSFHSKNVCKLDRFIVLRIDVRSTKYTHILPNLQCEYNLARTVGERIISSSEFYNTSMSRPCDLVLRPKIEDIYGIYDYKFCFKFKHFKFGKDGGRVFIRNLHQRKFWRFDATKLPEINKDYCGSYQSYSNNDFKISVDDYMRGQKSSFYAPYVGYHRLIIDYRYEVKKGVDSNSEAGSSKISELGYYEIVGIVLGVIVGVVAIVFLCSRKSSSNSDSTNEQAASLRVPITADRTADESTFSPQPSYVDSIRQDGEERNTPSAPTQTDTYSPAPAYDDIVQNEDATTGGASPSYPNQNPGAQNDRTETKLPPPPSYVDLFGDK